MLRVELKLENLAKLDGGKPEAMFRVLLKRCIADLVDRPSLDKARSVTMTISLRPADTTDAYCDHVDVEIDLGSKIPGYSSRPYSMKTHKNDFLSFHPDFPSEPDANGLLDDQDPDDQKKGGK